MKKSTIFAGIVFIIIFVTTIFVAVDKYKDYKDSTKKENKPDRDVLVGDIDFKIDTDNVSKSTNYNISVMNNVLDYVKNNVDFNNMDIYDNISIDSNDIVKDSTCNGDIIVTKSVEGIYSVDIDSECSNDNDNNSFSFKILGNLDNNSDIYMMEEVEDGVIAISNKNNGNKDTSASIMMLDDSLNLKWIYTIDDKVFNIRNDNGLKVIKVLESANYYYVLGYLNDDFGSLFGVKLDKKGRLEWQKIIDANMTISEATILSNKLVIVNTDIITFIDENGNIEEGMQIDVQNSKLANFKLGRMIFYDDNLYGINSKNSLNYGVFNSVGLLNNLYDVSDKVSTNGYLIEVFANDNKLFLNYDNGDLIIVDVFGRYIDNIESDNKIKVGINSNNFDIINIEENKYIVDKYNHSILKEKSSEILMIGDKNNIYNTDNKFYQYVTGDDYIIFAQFDK